VIVGLPDAAVKESRDRVMTALINSGFSFTFGRTTINLAPADVKKEGPSFDLPIAVGMAAASEQLETDQLDNFVMVGELALTGAVGPSRESCRSPCARGRKAESASWCRRIMPPKPRWFPASR
jgi:magnesium chelatase family protein